MCIGCALEIYIWLSNKVVCNIHIGDTLNYLNSRCNTAKLLWVVIYVVCYGRFSPDLVVMNICRQRLIKVKSPLWQRSLANENAVVCRQGAMRWRLCSAYNLLINRQNGLVGHCCLCRYYFVSVRRWLTSLDISSAHILITGKNAA